MKHAFVLLFWLLNAFVLRAQGQPVLMLIDIQEFYFSGGAMPLSEPEKAAKNAAEVLSFFREKQWPVIHVRHQFEPGGDIHPLVAPLGNEKVVTKREVNAFVGTNLLESLQKLEASEIVFAGMQTHMCLEAVVRAARDLGFRCTVLADACATRELHFDGIVVPAPMVHASTLATLHRNYARVVKTIELLGELDKN